MHKIKQIGFCKRVKEKVKKKIGVSFKEKSVFGHYSDFRLGQLLALPAVSFGALFLGGRYAQAALSIERIPNLFDFHINLSNQVRNPDRSNRVLCDSLECCNLEDGKCQASPFQTTCTGDYI